MKILAVDLGKARTGLAVCDEGEILASPVAVIAQYNREKLADAIAAKLAAKQAQERLEEAQKKLKTASPEVTAFKALFDSMQGTAAKLRTMIEKIRSEDPETADKLSAALKAFGSSL